MTSSPSAAPKPPRAFEVDSLLDASAMLALVFKEPGAEVVVEALRSGVCMSSVNAAEVAARLHEEGWQAPQVALVFDELGVRVLPFAVDVALLSGRYRAATRSLGLGLGDRACLATARIQGCPLLTADRAWAELDLEGVEVRCIR